MREYRGWRWMVVVVVVVVVEERDVCCQMAAQPLGSNCGTGTGRSGEGGAQKGTHAGEMEKGDRNRQETREEKRETA